MLSQDFRIEGRIVDVGDVDQDGYLDALTLVWPYTTVHHSELNGIIRESIWNQDEDPADHPGFEIYVDVTDAAQFADVDSDGWLDVVTEQGADGFTDLFATYNDGMGRSGARKYLAGCFGGCDFYLVDIAHDGDLDVLLTERDDYLEVLVNSGNREFEYEGSVHRRGPSGKPIVGDLNGDGNPDFLGDGNRWWDTTLNQWHVPGTTIELQSATSQVYSVEPLGKTNWVSAVAVGDLNQNQRSELIYGTKSALEFYELGQLVHSITTESSRVETIKLADKDLDGDLDIFYHVGDTVWWVENQGNHTYSAPRSAAQVRLLRYWDLGDVDGISAPICSTPHGVQECSVVHSSTLARTQQQILDCCFAFARLIRPKHRDC